MTLTEAVKPKYGSKFSVVMPYGGKFSAVGGFSVFGGNDFGGGGKTKNGGQFSAVTPCGGNFRRQAVFRFLAVTRTETQN